MTFSVMATNEVNNQSLLKKQYNTKNTIAEKLLRLLKQQHSVQLRREFISAVHNEVGLDSKIYRVNGKLMGGFWGEVCCASIEVIDITNSMNREFHILFLFCGNGEGLYVSLNQNWLYYTFKYQREKAMDMMKYKRSLLQEKLPIPYNLQVLSIILKGRERRGGVAKYFEEGHICGTYYDVRSFPSSEKIVANLLSLIHVYQSIDEFNINNKEVNDGLLLGEKGMFLEDDESEESFQKEIQRLARVVDVNEKEIDKKIRRRLPFRTSEGKESFPRRSSVSAKALIGARYKCVINEFHQTFTSKATRQQYVESHHIVPMSKQEHFEYELDQTANVAALCPNCHRLVHLGTDIEREELLRTVFLQRQNRLKKIGIEISFSQLKQMYDCK